MNTIGIAKATLRVRFRSVLGRSLTFRERQSNGWLAARVLAPFPNFGEFNKTLEGSILVHRQARSLDQMDEHLSRHRQDPVFAHHGQARGALIGRSFRAETRRSGDKIPRGNIGESQKSRSMIEGMTSTAPW